jgi:hypothetical protein
VRASSWSYSARIWDQSVSAADRASLCTALIAAWIWYGPGWFRRTHAATKALCLRLVRHELDQQARQA